MGKFDLDGLIRKIESNMLWVLQYADENGFQSVSWNHAKVVAVNNTTLTTGGANLWNGYGNGATSTFDAQVKIKGDATGQGHRYADAL